MDENRARRPKAMYDDATQPKLHPVCARLGPMGQTPKSLAKLDPRMG